MNKSKVMVVWPEASSEAAAICLEDAANATLVLFGSVMAEQCGRVRQLLGCDEIPAELRLVVVLDLKLDGARDLRDGKAGVN
jgi:hypothetical protein